MSAWSLRSNQIMNSTDTSSSPKVTTTLQQDDEHLGEADVAGEERVEGEHQAFATRTSVTVARGVDERRRPAAPGWWSTTAAAPSADRRRRVTTGSVTRARRRGDRDDRAGVDAEAVEVVRVQAQDGVGREAGQPGRVLHVGAEVVELAGGDQAQRVGVDAPGASAHGRRDDEGAGTRAARATERARREPPSGVDRRRA